MKEKRDFLHVLEVNWYISESEELSSFFQILTRGLLWVESYLIYF